MSKIHGYSTCLDDAGNHALQWYQHGMMCQITSKLPARNLLLLASTFAPGTTPPGRGVLNLVKGIKNE